ncbi:hypothetical protein [Fibrobacter sp.]|uniref:hypothetical protein n=1 Tax=Fibrobacter sp. TaxID=35828 RepID=UPI00388EBB10
MKKIIACALFLAVSVNFAGVEMIIPKKSDVEVQCCVAFDSYAGNYVVRIVK